MSAPNAGHDPAIVVPAAAAAGDPNAQLLLRLLGDMVADGGTEEGQDGRPLGMSAAPERPDGAEQLTEAEKRYVAPPCQPITVAGKRDRERERFEREEAAAERRIAARAHRDGLHLASCPGCDREWYDDGPRHQACGHCNYRDLPWPPGTPVSFPAVRLSTGEPTTAYGVITGSPWRYAATRMVRLDNSGGQVIEVRCDQLAERRP